MIKASWCFFFENDKVFCFLGHRDTEHTFLAEIESQLNISRYKNYIKLNLEGESFPKLSDFLQMEDDY